MVRKLLTPAALVLLALSLAACGSAPALGWAGLAADQATAYIAFNQQLHALSLRDGKQRWAFPPQANSNTGGFYSDPGLTDGKLVVGADGPGSVYSGALFGLDTETGAQRWCLAFDAKAAQRHTCPVAPGPDTSGLFGISIPTDTRIIGGIGAAGDAAYVGLANGWVYAVNIDDGAVRWTFQSSHAVWGTPAVDETSVYVGDLDHHLYALERESGEVRWKKDLGAAIAGQPVVADGRVFVGTFGSQLLALDTATGETAWSFDTSNWVWGGPVAQDGSVYFADLNGMVYAADAASGTQQWAVQPGGTTGGAMRAAPAIGADTLYVGDRSGTIFALARDNGVVRWQQASKGEILTTPVLAGDQVVVAHFQGENLVTAYSTRGTLQWVFAPSR